MNTRDFGMGFFRKMPFAMQERKELFEKWSKMTDAEKVEFMNKRMEIFNSENPEGENFFKERHFSVAAMDSRAEKWLKKTPEEKEAFIKERKEAIKNRCGGGFMGRGFGFGGHDCFFGESETQTK